jgi:acetyltransferase-like isoleucine patch superfamily enzyme
MLVIFFSVVKSLYFCISVFGFNKGIKLPILIHYKTKFNVAKNSIKLKEFKSLGIRFGFGGSEGVHSRSSNYLIVREGSNLVLHSNVRIAAGFSIRIENNSTLELGDNFYANKNLFTSCSNGILIDSDVLIGWGVEIRDADGHKVYYDGAINALKKVKIEKNVWITSYCLVLGNTHIKNNSVVAMRSLTNKEFEENTLIAGMPAKKIKTITGWER